VRVLIDTNIVLDFLLQREPFFQDVELLFQAIETGALGLADDTITACDRLLERCPDAQIWRVRIGHKGVHRFGVGAFCNMMIHGIVDQNREATIRLVVGKVKVMIARQPHYNKEEFARRGHEIFESQVRSQVEAGNHGKIVSIRRISC
jgi:hypothetical protein